DPLPELAVSEAPQVSIDDLLIGSLEQRRMPQMLQDERILIGGLRGRGATAKPARCRRLFWQRRPGYCCVSHLDSHSSSLPALCFSDPHTLPAQVKPGKSHQIVAKETTRPRPSDQETSAHGWR